jgi:hypothetical protein
LPPCWIRVKRKTLGQALSDMQLFPDRHGGCSFLFGKKFTASFQIFARAGVHPDLRRGDEEQAQGSPHGLEAWRAGQRWCRVAAEQDRSP